MRHEVTLTNPVKAVPLDVTVVTGRNSAVAAVDLYYSPTMEMLHATGESKRLPGDPFDGEIGSDLALGRALVNLGNALVNAAMQRSMYCGVEHEEESTDA
jgi:hypothetical protein